MPSTRRSGGSVPEPVLSIRDMTVEFGTEDGVVKAVTGVNYDLFPGEILGVIGESGAGKSVSVMTMLDLIPKPPGRVVSGEAIFKGRDLLTMSKSELRDVRGGDIAMIFQDPMTSLNPVLKVGTQIAEAVLAHNPKASDDDARNRAVELLELVGVPNAEELAEADRVAIGAEQPPGPTPPRGRRPTVHGRRTALRCSRSRASSSSSRS